MALYCSYAHRVGSALILHCAQAPVQPRCQGPQNTRSVPAALSMQLLQRFTAHIVSGNQQPQGKRGSSVCDSYGLNSGGALTCLFLLCPLQLYVLFSSQKQRIVADPTLGKAHIASGPPAVLPVLFVLCTLAHQGTRDLIA